MYTVLVRLIILAALIEIGKSGLMSKPPSEWTLSDFNTVGVGLLHIEWRPISLFPGETKRFR